MSNDSEHDLEKVDDGDDRHQATETDPHHAAADGALEDETVSETPPTRDEEMERLRRTAAEAEKRVLQAQAEAENFRKRMRRDLEDQLKFAATDLVVDLLEVRDNLKRAIDASQSGQESAGLREGVQMVVKQMDDVLAKHGVVEIPAEGEVFDPNLHEAISQIPSETESGRIAHVAVSGFTLHGRVIRPSQVVVSTGPAA
jgi:molecular chaperone GrpE